MKVKMLTSQAGIDFVREVGAVLDIADAEAIRMIDAGIAEPVREPEKRETAAKSYKAEKAAR